MNDVTSAHPDLSFPHKNAQSVNPDTSVLVQISLNR